MTADEGRGRSGLPRASAHLPATAPNAMRYDMNSQHLARVCAGASTAVTGPCGELGLHELGGRRQLRTSAPSSPL